MVGKNILHYEVISKLGEGGMGVVYLAEDKKLDRHVAIKFLPREIVTDREQRKRFQTEAKAAAALNHPNIGTVYAIEESENELFITMEYIDGQELKQIIAAHRENSMPMEDIIRYAIQIASGLQAAHAKGIVHRDIKPSNILITKGSAVKIMDFGLAKFRGAAQLTKTGTTLGTVAYMSPEQTLGESVDQRSDIWSFAVMLYEMISGHLPFQGDYDPAMQYAIVNSDPEDISRYVKNVPPELLQILAKALKKEAKDRYQTMAELLTDLQALNGEESVKIKTTSTKPKLLWPLTAVTVLILLLATYLLDPFALFTRQAVRTIAVLPFLDLSADGDQEYFADGLAEELLNILARNPQLRVTSRTSAFSFKGMNTDIKTIAAKLGVDHILEGSVRKAGNQIRITTQLIDVATDAQLWSKTYDQSMENIFEVQENISQSVAQALNVTLLGEKERIRHIKTNADAYNAFLQGDYFQKQLHSEESLRKAIDFYNQAIAFDPNYVRAWVSLGGAYINLYLGGYCNETCEDKAQGAVGKALEIEKNSADAISLKGFLMMILDWDLVEADKLIKQALKLEPDNVNAISTAATLALDLGRFEEAIDLNQRAIKRDPLNNVLKHNLGVCYLYSGRLEEAERLFKEILEFNPDYRGIQTILSDIYLSQGKTDLALAAMSKETEPGLRLYGLSLAYFAAGQNSRADSTLELLINNFRPVWDFQIAEIHAYRDETDQAFNLLESAYQQRDPGFLNIKVRPYFDNIKQDPRYDQLMKKVQSDLVTE